MEFLTFFIKATASLCVKAGVNVCDLIYCIHALGFCALALCGPRHGQFLWQHDFENSSPLQRPTAVASLCRLQPTSDA